MQISVSVLADKYLLAFVHNFNKIFSISKLSFLTADAAQEYSAIAIELGLLKPRSENQTSFSEQVDKSFVKEQKYLADLGINDFAENF